MRLGVYFRTESEKNAEQFVRTYALDAIDRVEEYEGCELLALQLQEDTQQDEWTVIFSVQGDCDEFINKEKTRWQKHQEAGLIEDWEKQSGDYTEQRHWKLGEQGAQLADRLYAISARMATVAYNEFEQFSEFPAPVDTYPDEESQDPVGWWIIPHHMALANLHFSATDEIDMCLQCIEEDLRIVAEQEDEKEVDRQIDLLVDELDNLREDVKEGRNIPETST